MVVYDAAMMQLNIFQGKMHITKCVFSQQGVKLWQIDTANLHNLYLSYYKQRMQNKSERWREA